MHTAIVERLCHARQCFLTAIHSRWKIELCEQGARVFLVMRCLLTSSRSILNASYPFWNWRLVDRPCECFSISKTTHAPVLFRASRTRLGTTLLLCNAMALTSEEGQRQSWIGDGYFEEKRNRGGEHHRCIPPVMPPTRASLNSKSCPMAVLH